MFPITRANLHSFCRTCLKEFDEPPGKQKASYDISNTENLVKWLGICSGKKFIISDGYPRCLCHSCYIKVRTFYEFYEKSSCSAEALKEVLVEIKSESMRKNLQLFCRTCLKRLNPSVENANIREEKNVVEWMLTCTGQDLISSDHKEFPERMCIWCFKKLRNFVEFRRVSNQSFEYLENVIGSVALPDEDCLVAKDSDLTKGINIANSENKIINIAEKLYECSDDKSSNIAIINTNCIKDEKKEYCDENKCFKNENDSDCEQINLVKEEQCLDFGDQDESAIEDLRIEGKSPNPIFVEKFPVFTNLATESNDSFILGAESDSTLDYNDNEFVIKNKSDNNNANPESASDCCMERKTINTNTIKLQKKYITPDMVKLRTDENSINVGDISEENESNRNSKEGTTSPKLSRRKKITCDQCGKKFYKKFLYDAHVKGIHEGLVKPFQCTICQNSFRFYHYLTRHIKEIHVNETIAASRRLAGEDEPVLHENVEEGHQCLFCCKIFKRKEHLKEHHEAVHLKIRRYPCRYCEKSFSAGKTRRVHEMGHTGEKPFVCDICNKGYRQISDLKVHMNQHSENKELLCPICNRMKSTREELDAHIAMHQASQQHQCSKCGRIFKKKCHLKDHDMSVHLKLRPFKCSFCELSFSLLKTQRTHEKLHLDECSEFCPTCGKGFKQRNQLLKHIKRLHKENAAKKEETNSTM